MPRPKEPTPGADPVPVERVGVLSRRPLFAVLRRFAIVVATLALRPWELAPRTTGPAPHPLVADASPAASSLEATSSVEPTTDPQIDAASSRMLCNAPPGWRLVTSETGPLGDTRTMYGADPSPASGPEDPSIPTANLYASRLFAFGVCRPNPGGLRVADLPFNPVKVWVVDGRGRPQTTLQTNVLDNSLYRLGEAYFAPRAQDGDAQLAGRITPSWPSGRYVLEIGGGGGDGSSLWIALDFALAGT